MKIRYIFEPSDFEGRGQIVTKCPTDSNSPISLTCRSWKIGYISETTGKRVAMIAMSDGMVIPHDTIEDLCEYLNSCHHGYRPTTTAELVLIMQDNGNRFR